MSAPIGPSSGQRSRKDLACTAAATAHQREFVADLKRRVIDNGEPFAIAQADTPHEIFHTLDIPLISNQWWSAYISAKQLSPRYFAVLDRLGYPANSCRYCSLGLACTLDNDPATAPWGGLPKPTVLVARLTCECIRHVFGQWADALGSEFFPLEAPGWTHKDPEWFRKSNTAWEDLYEPQRIELLVKEMEKLIELLETRTGRKFDQEKFVALMNAVNEQEGYIAEATQMIGTARPCPVSIAEQMPNTMIPQWHRGSPWAVSHAKRFRDEVAQRIADGVGASSNERVRLMWIGAGLWHDPGFYSALEDRYGAVFVWSMYMPFAGPQYIRELHNRPMHALASRVCSMNEVLHLPPWMNEWMVSEAKRCGINAAVILVPPDNRLSQSGTKLTQIALEDAGIPALMISADMVDAKEWNHEAMVEHAAGFLRSKGIDMRVIDMRALWVIAILVVAGCARAPADGVTVLTYASPYAPTHPFSRADITWMKWIEQQSHGQLRVEPFWSGSLLSSEHSMTELRHGVVDIGLITPIYARGGAHLIRVQAGFYGGLTTFAQQVELYQCMQAANPQFTRELNGLVVLAVQGGNLPGIVTREKPIHTLTDLRGMRLRAPSELLPTLKYLGADPVDMPMGEVYSALAKGVIDGVVAPTDTLKSLHFAEVAHYFNTISIPRGAYAARAMGQRRWESLTSAQQDLLKRGIKVWEDALSEELAKAERSGEEAGRAHGIEFAAMPASDFQEFLTIYNQFAERGAAGLQRYQIDGMKSYRYARALAADATNGGTVACKGG